MVGDSLGTNFTLSFFVRTLKAAGLLLQIHNESKTVLTIYLKDGRLQVEAPPATVLSPSGHLADGQRHLVVLTFWEGIARASLRNGEEENLGPLVVYPLAAGTEIHVGGLPDQDTEAWGGHFKGCLQDLQLNHQPMRLFPRQASDDVETTQEIYVAHATNILTGCVSDDTCQVRESGEGLLGVRQAHLGECREGETGLEACLLQPVLVLPPHADQRSRQDSHR